MMKKRWLKPASILFAAIVLLFLSAYLLFKTPLINRVILSRIRVYLETRSKIDLSASRMTLDILKGTVTLDDVIIRSTFTPELPPFFSASRIYAKPGIIRILGGALDIEELQVSRPAITYIIQTDGRTNFPSSRRPSQRTPKFLIAHADITDASLLYSDLRSNIILNLPRWRLRVVGNRTTLDHDFDFITQRPSIVQYNNRSFPVSYLTVLGVLTENRISLEMLQLSAFNSKLTAKGSVDNFSNPSIHLQLESTLALHALTSTLGWQKTVQGTLSGKITADGTRNNLDIRTDLRGQDISGFGFGSASLDLRSHARWDSQRLQLLSFDLNTLQGAVRGNAEFDRRHERETNAIHAEINNFDLYPAWKLIKPPFDLASRASGKVSLSWKGLFSTSTVEVNANLNLLAARTVPDRHVLPISGNLDVQMRSGRLMGSLRAMSAMGARLSGGFSLVSFKTVDADIHGEAPDLGATLSQVAQFVGAADPILGVRTAGPIVFDAQVSGRLVNPKVVAAANSPALEVDVLKNLAVKADAVIEDLQVPFHATISMPDKSVVSAHGALGFAGSETTLNLDARTDRMPAHSILPVLGTDVPLTGDLKASLFLDGPLNDLTGKASVSGNRMALYREPLGSFTAELNISGGEIQSDQFRILRDAQNPNSNYIDARLRYRPGTSQFEFQASGKDLIWEQKQLPKGRFLDGTIQLVISGEGTFAHPSIDLRLESGELHVHKFSLGPISVSATLRDKQAKIETFAQRLNASSAIQITTQSPYPFESELQIRDADLSSLGLNAANNQPLHGSLAATVTGSGNLDALAAAQFLAQIQKLDLRSGNLEVHTEGLTEVEYRDSVIAMRAPATVVSGNSKLQVAGRLPLRQTASADLLTLKGQLDLAQAAVFLPMPVDFEASGNMQLDLSLAGTLQKLSPGGTIALDDGFVRIPQIPAPFSNVRLRANLENGSLMLQRADATVGEGALTIKGEMPFGLLPAKVPVHFLRKEGPARFALDLAGFHPEAAGILPNGLRGIISMQAAGQIAGTDLRTLDAELVFRELKFNANEIALGQKEPSTIVVRNGIASIAKLAMTGTETSIEASGSAGLFREGPLNLQLLGSFDAGLITFMSRDLKMAGRMQVQAAIGGIRRAPSLSGTAEMKGGRLTIRNPRVVADSLNIRLNLAPNQITVQEFNSTLNGGTITMDGTLGYRRGSLTSFNLKAAIQDVFLDFPDGFRSASNGNLTITSSEESILVGGTMRIMESSYREPFAVAGQLMGFLKSQQAAVGGSEPDPFLERIRLDIALRTVSPLLVQNNIAKVEANANLTLVGRFYQPSLVGRVTLDQGGEIVMNQRTYYIERGTITFNDQFQVRPELDLEAQTSVDAYDITLRLAGPPERLSTILSSEPSLPEPDIISLLLTGKPSSESTQQVAQTQALALIAGQAGEEVTREARQALHLSTLRIDPAGLIASESDAGARLTIGQDITRDLNLAYSMNLVDGGKQIWIAQYRIMRRLTTQATKQEDNSYRFEFRHDLRFGGAPTPRASRASSAKFTIGSIRFEGPDPASEKSLLERFKVKPGEKYDFPKVQKGLDRLHDFYSDQKRFEADIRLQRNTQERTVDLDVSIGPGPVVDFSYTGMPLAATVKEDVEKAWRNGVFDVERLEDAVSTIRRALLQEGYLQPEISHRVEWEGEKKTVHFHINSGIRYQNVPVAFPGASEISAAELSSALERADLGLDVYADPQKIVDYFRQYYRDRGYLQASIDFPQPRLDKIAARGDVAIPVREGPLFKVGELEFSGNKSFEYDELWSVIPTSSGSIYSPQSMQDAIKALESLYNGKGFNEASATYSVIQNSGTALADVTFQIAERRQSIIRDIVIEGNEGTSTSFVQRQLDFKVGDALDVSKIDITRKRLYATGVYASVDFQNEEMAGAGSDSEKKDVRVRIRLREVSPYRLQYGLFYDNERGPGGLFEMQSLNLFGRATTLGMKLRYDSDLKEGRLYFNQPFVTNNFLKLDATAFVQREDRVAFSSKRIGFSLFRQKTLTRRYVLDYGYRYDHVRWNGLPPDPTLFQASVPVARLVATLSRDTRDSILDATRGEFASHSFELGPRFLGSEIGYTRYSGQYFRYVPLDKYLGKPVKDRQGNRLPASLVYAGALRLGLTSAFGGQEVISPERFFAGGGTTMRGFQQDMLGPTVPVIDPETGNMVQRPVGGEAMFLFNNEIRFPLVSVFQGVGFVDVGNVYPRISDFDFSLRKTAGFGLRVKIKFIPIRFDYGFKLDRRPGESRGAFFFSIGQAF
jgi:outer membrane protein assembly complex protein YaeT